MITKWKKYKLEKDNKILIKVSIVFIISAMISGRSCFVLENKNKKLKKDIIILKNEKDKLENEIKNIDGKILKIEKSFKDITEKLDINFK